MQKHEIYRHVKEKTPAVDHSWGFALLLLVNADALAILAHTLEPHDAIRQSEQGVIGTDAHVRAGMDMGATLTDQNVAGQHELTVGTLHAEALGLGITAVLGGANALLVSEELDVEL